MEPVGRNGETIPVVNHRLGDKDFWVEASGKFKSKDAKGYYPTLDSDKLKVDIPNFTGPLDLLLYLINRHCIDIFDIPIILITEKYLETIENMKAFNLDVAGEFILMSATLIKIKSKMLLPKDLQKDDEDDEHEEDPRAKLVKRLLEYQKFKEAGNTLQKFNCMGKNIFGQSSKQFAEIENLIKDDLVKIDDVQIFDMVKIFAKVLENASSEIIHEVKLETISVRARIVDFIDFIRIRETCIFEDVLKSFHYKSKADIIVTFLAMLEMVKLKLIRVSCQDNIINITINQKNVGQFKEHIIDETI